MKTTYCLLLCSLALSTVPAAHAHAAAMHPAACPAHALAAARNDHVAARHYAHAAHVPLGCPACHLNPDSSPHALA